MQELVTALSSLSFLIIFINSLSPAPRAADVGASTKEEKSQKITLLPIASKFGPQEVNGFSQLCA